MASLVPEKDIQQVKYAIESCQFMRALQMINSLQSMYQSSAYVLALKALVYKKIGLRSAALSICQNLNENFSADTTDLHEVLNTLQIVCHLLGEDDLATEFYKKACSVFPHDLDLMNRLFYCYHRESSFANQLEISLQMYKSSGKRMFLFWSLFSIQLQACCQWLTKHMKDKNIDEPETLLVYMSTGEPCAINSVLWNILSKLGPTLLVAEVAGKRIKGVRLLAHVSDYTAAEELLREYLNLRGRDSDIREVTGYMFGLSEPLVYHLACKLSQWSNDECGSEMSEVLNSADLQSGKKRCLVERESELDEAVNEYFNRFGTNFPDDVGVSLQVFTKAEEFRLIANLLGEKELISNALQESLLSVCRERTRGCILPGEQSLRHGTIIALKTKNFIILAADGKLTSRYSYRALGVKADKLKDFDGMCVALTGDWNNFSRMRSTLCRHIKFLKDEGKGRPTVISFANFESKIMSNRIRGTSMIFGAFEWSKDGRFGPCISYADDDRSFEIEESFFCAGTGSPYAYDILSEGNVNEDMTLDEARTLVERALAYASMFDSGCTGGWSSIHVIKDGKSITMMPREQISTTLWRRHYSSFEFI